MSCFVVGCELAETMSWQRWATPEEIEMYHESGDLPMSETTAKILVLGCDDHTVNNPQVTHAATCAAPGHPCCEEGEVPPDLEHHD